MSNSDVILSIENVSKQYQLGTFGTRTIGGDVHRWWKTKVMGQEDPLLKVGEINDRTSKDKAEFVWALKDINFEVKRGEVLGIIGKNGAGKSTLLKLLSRVTSPTIGTIKSRGRMASLLEVGTGFHPELTGLENIFLNGAILGMTKAEIKTKLDEIVDFSGCSLYIDTPVKRYSSGMKVRLGFAVAAFLDPEILVVDEVLAVGDAEFQKKAIGKMQDVSRGEGRTVLFVSHNMASIKALCKSGLVLNNGQISFHGNVDGAIEQYISQNEKVKLLTHVFETPINKDKSFQLIKAVTSTNGVEKAYFEVNEPIDIRFKIHMSESIPGLYGYLVIKNMRDELIVECDTKEFGESMLNGMEKGINNYRISIPSFFLAQGDYLLYLNFGSAQADEFNVDSPFETLRFVVQDNYTTRGLKRTALTSYIFNWTKE